MAYLLAGREAGFTNHSSIDKKTDFSHRIRTNFLKKVRKRTAVRKNRPTWRDCITAVMFMLSVLPVIAITILMAVLAKMARMAPLAIMAVIAVMAVMAFLITWTCLKGLES